nr:trypsin-like peptidase domain-containing protein [Chloroflexota bacterium]
GEIAAGEQYEKAPGRRIALPRWALALAIVVPLLVVGLLASFWIGGLPATPETPLDETPPTTSEPVPDETPEKTPPPEPSTPSSLTDTIAKVQPSVVLIVCEYGYDKYGSGSGVIVDERGYILTNKHVIEGAREIYVYLLKGKEVKVGPGTELEANVVSRHSTADLAIIQISSSYTTLAAATLGNSDALKPGVAVIAIGYPLVYYDEASESVGSPTITEGIVSAELRRIDGVPHIQIDAALNPGNSGGALINTNGEVVGTPTFRWEETAEGRMIQNINFAIAINYARPFIDGAIGK